MACPTSKGWGYYFMIEHIPSSPLVALSVRLMSLHGYCCLMKRVVGLSMTMIMAGMLVRKGLWS
jgi:hypothetical protein